MSALLTTKAKDEHLSLGRVLNWMIEDGLVPQAEADALHRDASRLRSTRFEPNPSGV